MLTRRQLLQTTGQGFGALAFHSLASAETTHRSQVVVPKAKRVVQLFMGGAASHIDLFDYKPALIKHHGEDADFGEKVEAFQNGLGPWKKPVWDFKPYGKSGRMLSDAVAPLGACADDMAFVHNLVGKTGVHSQGTLLQATGFNLPGFPGVGCWVSYALGSISDNLPTFVVLPDHRGFASNGPKNWDSAFLPSQHAGTIIYPGAETPIADLFPHKAGRYISAKSDREGFALLEQLNRKHMAAHPEDSRLESRIQSYELAAKMQLAAPEALDISKESDAMKAMYGIQEHRKVWPTEINPAEEADYMGRKCLAARRLLERGVRFVQIWSGNDNGFPRRNWDSHEDVERDHGPLAWGMAKAVSALILDLKQRGLLDDTIILWTTEFGRMPSTQGGKGRDHNPFCFTNWLTGGGIRGGVTHGLSDDFGYKPLDRRNPTEVYDVHATILHLLGINHEQLTFRAGGVDRRLTDVHGHVIRNLLA